MADYPERESHFANKFTRLLLRTCAAQEIGHVACLLLIQIAHTEDAAHYRRPVTFWNQQLMSVLALSKGQLLRARNKAIGAGWLQYEKGGKGRVGKYFVLVPKVHVGLPDHPIDEDFLDLSVSPVTLIPPAIGNTSETRTGREPGENRATSAPLSNLRPKPSPSPKKETFDPMTVELPFPSDRFRQSWGDFCQHRKNIKVALTELAATRLLNKCRLWGEAKAIQAIDVSIENGWKGLFEQKEGNRHGKATSHGHRNQSGRPAIKSIKA